MFSHTVRVFKMMYIVAGILISNAEICDTVDRIQIAPRVDLKPEFEQRALTFGGNSGSRSGSRSRSHSRSNSGSSSGEESGERKRGRRVSVTGLAGGVVRGVTSQVSKRVGHRFGWLYDVRLILQQWRSLALSFNLWTIPNFIVECVTSYMSKKLLINSDCDMIYK
ncbi:uncharacterized protein [Drosophila pseudoobscura]|uniref:Uncharacterized protein n=1 Tax=Drosophila pseudoobscura pseudoobscura TaxID=46245 RepID=A0A6I8UBF9_DROPS|nr:uncharacterized protein LOC4811978 [Drosophila pseudoobscura]